MPELRQDPISGRWVIIAKGRAARPQEYRTKSTRIEQVACPFCEGQERMTPSETMAIRDHHTVADSPGWRVRVVPNRFPAVDKGSGVSYPADKVYVACQAIGVHDVIIESPRHIRSITELSDSEAREVFLVYRDRLGELKGDTRLAFGLVFKNVGDAAGASLEHIHSQLIATSIIPVHLRDEWQLAGEFYRQHGSCVFCEIVQRETSSHDRIVVDSPRFLAYCPFASRFPYEMCVLPKLHESHFEEMDDESNAELASVMRRLIGLLEATMDSCSYNYLIHTSPFDTESVAHYHWHIEVLPRSTNAAGFEWGTGYYINPVPPEEAALHFRELSGRSGLTGFPSRKPS